MGKKTRPKKTKQAPKKKQTPAKIDLTGVTKDGESGDVYLKKLEDIEKSKEVRGVISETVHEARKDKAGYQRSIYTAPAKDRRYSFYDNDKTITRPSAIRRLFLEEDMPGELRERIVEARKTIIEQMKKEDSPKKLVIGALLLGSPAVTSKDISQRIMEITDAQIPLSRIYNIMSIVMKSSFRKLIEFSDTRPGSKGAREYKLFDEAALLGLENANKLSTRYYSLRDAYRDVPELEQAILRKEGRLPKEEGKEQATEDVKEQATKSHAKESEVAGTAAVIPSEININVKFGIDIESIKQLLSMIKQE